MSGPKEEKCAFVLLIEDPQRFTLRQNLRQTITQNRGILVARRLRYYIVGLGNLMDQNPPRGTLKIQLYQRAALSRLNSKN